MLKDDVPEKTAEFLSEFYKNQLSMAASEGAKSINVDFALLDQFDVQLADRLLDSPDETIPLMEEAVKQLDVGPIDPKLRLRFFNLPESKNIRIRNLRAEHIGKLIVIDGIIKRATDIRPEVSEAVFKCMECGNEIPVAQSEKTITMPAKCDCGNRKDFKLSGQKLHDTRWVFIEETFEITSGERPSDLMVYLKEDLTTPKMQNKTDPGNNIKIVGVLKEMPKAAKGTSRSRQLDIYLDVNHVESIEVEWEELEITPDIEQQILELAHSPDIYGKFIRSIAPAIYGNDEIKESIMMQLFGGEEHIQKDKSKVRGDIHILLVGDPSTSKSAMMKVASMLIPRGRYVSGKGVSQAGLTASVIKEEEFLGGWVLEAGAMVLSNRSMISIDEFEKIDKSDIVALHEAMEMQTISIAKANIVATLPAHTAVLAGGNPKLGRFDPYVPIKEQIDIPDTILTRFDLKFALRDIPNAERDEMIAEHILQARHFEEVDIKPEIDTGFLRKYVAYARKTCHPKLSREAGNEIKKFYLELRAVSGEDSAISITPRQYEALIRMSEASAKVQLRNEVSKEDALRAINIMKTSLRQFGFDPETGKIDIDRAEGAKATAAQRSKIRIIEDIISELILTYGKEIPTEELIRHAKEQGVERPEEIVSKMQSEGVIFSPSAGKISKV
ncbi:minichromosome maintenance protein MCM [archaeon]|nr:MAG: minichromosome maintenance protein MCM [archaeon]